MVKNSDIIGNRRKIALPIYVFNENYSPKQTSLYYGAQQPYNEKMETIPRAVTI